MNELSQEDFASLLAFRTGLRRYLRWSETRVREAGLTPAQHQLLLAIKGHGPRVAPTVGELAGYLLLRHHSTVELIDRAERAGLVRRGRDAEDNRVIRVSLTPAADRVLSELTRLHLAELQSLAPILERLSAELRHLENPHPG
ncbi:MarR family winged helix-turn-helix transcriptional regulator [Actinomadura montaniterrae]|uniref:MarR family transcriptional regulator n=1 Tax=Actinomadura montaniterrae TaxID=1803903 RepID=A0A6L3W2G7_9ACTN|nr:MarR family transcriptional regulator [Actinomadura montaniterrae]KAB2381910.1 MarR family transcriptional regulator [Actinomadura montaniterrae]